MKAILFAVVVSLGLSTAAQGSELPAALVDPYVRVQAALAADKIDTLKQDSAEIAKAATSLGAPASKLADAAQKLGAAADLKAARDAFGRVSDELFAYVKSQGATVPASVKTVYCPMANKSWLQKGDKIQNPYYGTEMQECGEFKK